MLLWKKSPSFMGCDLSCYQIVVQWYANALEQMNGNTISVWLRLSFEWSKAIRSLGQNCVCGLSETESKTDSRIFRFSKYFSCITYIYTKYIHIKYLYCRTFRYRCAVVIVSVLFLAKMRCNLVIFVQVGGFILFS